LAEVTSAVAHLGAEVPLEGAALLAEADLLVEAVHPENFRRCSFKTVIIVSGSCRLIKFKQTAQPAMPPVWNKF